MSAGQTVTIVAKDTNTGSPLNRLSSAPIPLIMVANSRIPSTFDNDFHNWPGIISPVRQQLQEALSITAPSDGTYFVSILGGTILYDAPESIDIFVIPGTGTYDNCWDDKLDAIKPRDVSASPSLTHTFASLILNFCSGTCQILTKVVICPFCRFKSRYLLAAAGSSLRLR